LAMQRVWRVSHVLNPQPHTTPQHGNGTLPCRLPPRRLRPSNAQDQRRAKAKNDRQALSPRPLNLDVRLISIQKGYSCVERTLQDQRSHLFGATTGQFGTIKKTWKIVAVPTSSIFIIKTCNTSSNSAPL
jgi:hypothetical protein